MCLNHEKFCVFRTRIERSHEGTGLAAPSQSSTKKIGDGCHLERKIDDFVLGDPFEITSLKRYHLQSVPKSYLCLNGPIQESASLQTGGLVV